MFDLLVHYGKYDGTSSISFLFKIDLRKIPVLCIHYSVCYNFMLVSSYVKFKYYLYFLDCISCTKNTKTFNEAANTIFTMVKKRNGIDLDFKFMLRHILVTFILN